MIAKTLKYFNLKRFIIFYIFTTLLKIVYEKFNVSGS